MTTFLMRDRLVRLIATGFGAGHVPFAPGLAGSVVGLAYWWVLAGLPAWLFWTKFVAVALLAVWIAGEAAREIG